MEPHPIRNDVDHVVREVVARVEGRKDRLVELRVTRPSDLKLEELKAMLRAHLADRGIDFVCIVPTDREGPIRLLGTEFEAQSSPEAGISYIQT